MEIKELIESAKKIKDFCTKQDLCRDCPFSYDSPVYKNECMFIKAPLGWHLKEVNNG